MNGDLLLGIDVGTTMTKAVVTTVDGHELSWGRSPTPWRPFATGAEADPHQFLAAAVDAAGQALEAAPEGRVVGLGVTSVAETVVLLGHDGQPVAPCIAWHDQRGEEQAADLVATFGRAAFSRRTGLAPSHVCTLVKLAWMTRHRDIPMARAMSIADWVAHMLGGEQAAEASLASRTGALSLKDRTWWAEGLVWAGVPPSLFPSVAQAGTRLGQVTHEVLGRLPLDGLPASLGRLPGAAVACAGHDHLCGAAGSGVLRHDQVLDSCGTAEALVRSVPALSEDEVARVVQSGLNTGWHTLPGSYALVQGHFLGLVLDRVLSLLGVEGRDRLEALDRAAADVTPGTLRVTQGGPYTPPAISGLAPGCSPAALWAAALVCVTEAPPKGLAAMEVIAGPAEELVLSGGWSRCAGLRRAKVGLAPKVRWPSVVEAGARGAALFGGCAAGLFAGPADFPVPEDQPWDTSVPGPPGPAIPSGVKTG